MGWNPDPHRVELFARILIGYLAEIPSVPPAGGRSHPLSEYAVEIRGITKRFRDKVAVNNVDLNIRAGSLCGFLGPNGAGKTTTIRMIMSIFYPDSGTLRVLGKGSAIESKDRIGYLPEERGVYKKMKVGQFLNYMGKLKGLPASGVDKRVRDWLDRMALGDTYKKKCEELSKGMQQKVQLIAALIHEPDLLILDEPFSGLDPVNRRLLRTIIEEQNDAGRTVIFSTHAMFEAEQLCDHLFMINKGEKVLDMRTAEVWKTHDPRSLVVQPLSDSPLDEASLAQVPGVEHVRRNSRGFEIQLHDGTAPGSVMRDIAGRFPVRSIEIKRPSLDDIFIGLVGGDAAALAGLASAEEQQLVET